MPRRKKQTPTQKIISWLDDHHKIMWLLVIVLVLGLYLIIHSYRGWADTRRLHAARQAIDTVYADVGKRLGQPDDLKSTNSCTRQSALTRSYLTCSVETDFIYGAANQTQANILLNQIQKTVAARPKLFKATRKLSPALVDNLVYDSFVHTATDTYRGPYGASCTLKYSFATPDQVTLSLRDPGMQPFEVFFSCSHRSVKVVYPLSNPVAI